MCENWLLVGWTCAQIRYSLAEHQRKIGCSLAEHTRKSFRLTRAFSEFFFFCSPWPLSLLGYLLYGKTLKKRRRQNLKRNQPGSSEPRGLPTAPTYMSPNVGGRGGIARSQPMSTAVHRSPNKLWRSNSIFPMSEPVAYQQKRTSSCSVQDIEQSKCLKLTIDTNIQLALHKANISQKDQRKFFKSLI
jgi:hypothetical protein